MPQLPTPNRLLGIPDVLPVSTASIAVVYAELQSSNEKPPFHFTPDPPLALNAMDSSAVTPVSKFICCHYARTVSTFLVVGFSRHFHRGVQVFVHPHRHCIIWGTVHSACRARVLGGQYNVAGISGSDLIASRASAHDPGWVYIDRSASGTSCTDLVLVIIWQPNADALYEL